MNRKGYWELRRHHISMFRNMLNKHDWYYHQSHDSRRWEAGIASEENIKRMAKDDYILTRMYEARKKQLTKRK